MSGDAFFRRAYEERVPSPDIPTDRPTSARVYDYLLGGKDNFAVDREVGDRLLELDPRTGEYARANRAFLGRVVRHLVVDEGIDQIIDIGSGLPAQDNVHEVAHRHNPDTRVVYVDHDPIVLAHARALLEGHGTTRVVDGDARRPREILDHPDTRAMIDFDRPVAVLFLSVLHYLSDEDRPREVLRAFTDRMAAGGFVALSHASAIRDQAKGLQGEKLYTDAEQALHLRSWEEIAALVDGFTFVEPGLCDVTQWGIEPTPRRSPGYGGMVRVPASP